MATNLAGYDAAKHGARPVVGDAKVSLEKLSALLGGHRYADPDFEARDEWFAASAR